MDNERPLRLYRHKKKVYYKNGMGGKHLISVPNGMSNVSGSAGKDLYNINIMYGEKKTVRGRSKKKKPEIPILTQPITENHEPIVVQKYAKQTLGSVPIEKPLPTYISRNAVSGVSEVPTSIEEKKKEEIPVDHNMPNGVEDDDIPQITHFNLPTEYDEERDVEEYDRLPQPFTQEENEPTMENKPITYSKSKKWPTVQTGVEERPFEPVSNLPQRLRTGQRLSEQEDEGNSLIYESLRSGVPIETPGVENQRVMKIWKRVYDTVQNLTVSEIKEALRNDGFEKSTTRLLKPELSQVLVNRVMKKFNSGDPKTVEQFGSGIKEKSALSNIDIENIFKKYDGKIVPVIASDMILSLLPQVNTKTKQFYFVMNVAPHKSNGKKDGHWIAWCLDNERKTLYYYNSLARPAKSRWLKDIKTLIKKMDPVHMWKYKYNAVRNQSFKTSDCGYFASHFIHTMMEGGSFSKATFYNHSSLQAERELKPFIKKWGFI